MHAVSDYFCATLWNEKHRNSIEMTKVCNLCLLHNFINVNAAKKIYNLAQLRSQPFLVITSRTIAEVAVMVLQGISGVLVHNRRTRHENTERAFEECLSVQQKR